jgi:nicotinate phosphoribosyltransferase
MTPEGIEDWLGLAEEAGPEATTPLLEPVMEDGKRLHPREPLGEARARCQSGLAALPEEALRLRDPVSIHARPTEGLVALRREIERRLGQPAEVGS